MLGYPPTPLPGAWRLTARPADPQGLGQPRGGGWGSPAPLQPPKLSHTPRGHTLAGGGPRGYAPAPEGRVWSRGQCVPSAVGVRDGRGGVPTQTRRSRACGLR